MELKKLVKKWFEKWEEGDFNDLPIGENFKHTSPYGVIDGKEKYLEIVKANEDKFLGYRFDILDEIYENDRACVRYTAIQNDFTLEVSEWYFLGENEIKEIVAYYNIEGEISEERKLTNVDW